jgi:hypothetical protein
MPSLHRILELNTLILGSVIIRNNGALGGRCRACWAAGLKGEWMLISGTLEAAIISLQCQNGRR